MRTVTHALDIQIGHSPDPDDAFLFYAMTNHKIDLQGLRVSHCLEGIEQLNDRAIRGELEMTAISLHAYPYCADRYLLLTAGASIGEKVGPIVVTRQAAKISDLQDWTVAIPGTRTTASLLFQLAVGVGKTRFVVLPFDQILEAVATGKVQAGVLIHEGQLTYADSGLHKVLDLGIWWWEKTQLPVPLGVNVVRRDLGKGNLQKIAAVFQQSLEYALAHRQEALEYAQQFSRGLDWERNDRFVGMYVNRWSIDCRPDGAAAMQKLLDWAHEEKLIPQSVRLEFVES